MANKPITPEEMKAYVDATWEKCQAEAWQEPVAWYHPKSSRVRFENPNSLLWTPLYTAPRQWQGLTDDEKRSLVEWAHPDIIDAIELRLRERNNG
jgi:hypothetical protein